MAKGFLLLENGRSFEGVRYDTMDMEPVGELAFSTGMTGYLESITDPSYYGQMLIQTFPLIGNYGVIPDDFESGDVHLKAYIINKLCELPSNFRSTGTLGDFLTERRIPLLLLKDTRTLTKIVREQGVMNAMISYDSQLTDEKLEKIRRYKVKNAVNSVTSSEITVHKSGGMMNGKKVILMDFGTKSNIINELSRRCCEVTVVPAGTTAQVIKKMKPDGIMLSNGPGDPAENKEIISELKILTGTGIPIFGICLGHQLLALACDAKTKKMTYGHRGANQPVMNIETERVYITSQNHGYCVDPDTLPKSAVALYTNINDGTSEGVRYSDFPGFSVQFHPEACGGPLDMNFLFDNFIELMKEVDINA